MVVEKMIFNKKATINNGDQVRLVKNLANDQHILSPGLNVVFVAACSPTIKLRSTSESTDTTMSTAKRIFNQYKQDFNNLAHR